MTYVKLFFKSIFTFKFSFSLFLLSIISYIYIAPSPDTNPLINSIVAQGVVKDKYVKDGNNIFVINKKAVVVNSTTYSKIDIGQQVSLSLRIEDYEGKRWIYYLTSVLIVISFLLLFTSFLIILYNSGLL